jgi:hypothetical protein
VSYRSSLPRKGYSAPSAHEELVDATSYAGCLGTYGAIRPDGQPSSFRAGPDGRQAGSGPPYNRAVAAFDGGNRSGVLSRDTSTDVERLQIEAWRRMSPLEKAAIMSQATSDALTLARSGIRQRYPGASERECFIRLAALQLGRILVRQVYPDASQILGPHV